MERLLLNFGNANERECRMDEIVYRPIGVIRTPFTDVQGMPIQAPGGKGIRGRVELAEGFVDGLKDLDGFSYIVLVYHFHLSSGYSLEITPFLDDTPRGVFATRAPTRPNSIGLSVVKLVKVEGNVLDIEDIDVVDGTLLLDIKPFVPQFDNRDCAKIGWLTRKVAQVHETRSDKRFGQGEEQGT